MRTQAGDFPSLPVSCLLSGILPNFVSFQPFLIIQIHWPSSITTSLPWKRPFFSQWKENSPCLICPGDASCLLEVVHILLFIVHVQFSCVFVTPWTAACQASLSITNSRSPPKPMSIESVMPSNHLILSSPSPPTFNLFQQGLFKWISSLHQVAKVLEF